MKIAIRGGHNYGVTGASSKYMDEVDFDRKYSKSVMNYLKQLGHEVLDVTPDRTSTSGQDLSYGVKKANEWGADLFISCHVNCYNGSAKGCEVIYLGGSTKSKEYAERVVNSISKLGFTNRGPKSDTRGLYELKATHMSSIIIEPFFLDNKSDIDIITKIGHEKLGQTIAESIVGKEVPIISNIDGKTGICTGDGVRIRSTKDTSTKNNILGKLNKGDKVKLYRKEGDWYHIYYPQHGGFVSADYIKEM